MIINFNDFTQEEMSNIQKVYDVAEKELALPQDLEVNLVIVSPDTIKEMNNKYIMSFVFPSHSTNLRIYRNNLLRYNNKFKS